MKRLALTILNTVIYFRMKRSIFIFVFISCFNLLIGQTISVKSPADSINVAALNEAGKSFQNGLYEQCVKEIQAVLLPGHLAKNQSTLALELLARAEVELNDMDEADETVRSLLKNNPHYELKESENSEGFNRLVNTYRVHPLFSVGIRNTANWIRFKSLKTYTVLDGMDYNSPYAGPKYFGFFYYAWLEYEFIPSVSVNAEWIFMNTFYNRTLRKDPGIVLTFTENFNFTEVPMSVRKYFPVAKNITSYASLGVCYLKMNRAEGYAGLTVNDSSQYLNKVNMMPMRNKVTFEFTAGAGIGYQIKNLRLFLDMRYYSGLNNLSNPAKRNENSTLINDYFYIDNSFKLKQFALGASVSYTLFNSVKKIRY